MTDFRKRKAEVESKFTVNLREVDGYELISKDTGKHYELLEGISYGGRSTSDLVFIFWVTDESGYKQLVNFTAGATFTDDCLYYCMEMILNYEAGEPSNLDHIFE